MFTKPEPASRCHWYLKVLPTPAQVPGAAVRTLARAVVPVGAGTALLTGGAVATATVSSEVEVAVPSTLVAVTMTCSFAATSTVCTV